MPPNAARHGPFAARTNPSFPEEAHLRGLLDALTARHRPADAAEMHWVRQMAMGMVRAERLDALEFRVMDVALEGAAALREAGLPSPATVLRYRARLERDHERAVRELEALREERPGPAAREPTPGPMREPGSAARQPTPGPDMSAQIARMEAEAAADTARVMGWLLEQRAGRDAMPGMNEPGPVAAPAVDRTGRPRTEVRPRQTQRA
ncbi:hypothetical protein SH611_00275 [Geminicoccaceae bacterium 1502E]|nr:hypothetical protein [Geminicoccaceae bacterium 1502E]